MADADQPRRPTRYEWGKLVVGVVGVLVLGAATYVGLTSFLGVDAVADQGDRGLVVVATEGGTRDYNLNVRTFYDQKDVVRLVFYFTQKGTSYDAPQEGDKAGNKPPERIGVELAFVGEGYEGAITCGTSPDDLNREPFSELKAGTRAAIDIDQVSSRSSATNFDLDGEREEVPDPALVKVWRGELWTNPDGEYFRRRTESWVEECRLPTSSVWKSSRTGLESTLGLGVGNARSLVPPQLNFTSQAESADHQGSLWSDATVARRSGLVLREGYPPPVTGDDAWTYGFHEYSTGTDLEGGLVRYTDQPVWIFGQRTAAQVQALALTLIGTSLGVIAALLVQLLSRTADLVHDSRRYRRSQQP